MMRDLFDFDFGPEQPAEVKVFPLAKRVGEVRRVARSVLNKRTPDTQQRAFDRAARDLAISLRSLGAPETEVVRQIDLFTAAVNAELARLQFSDRRSPGGAA